MKKSIALIACAGVLMLTGCTTTTTTTSNTTTKKQQTNASIDPTLSNTRSTSMMDRGPR